MKLSSNHDDVYNDANHLHTFDHVFGIMTFMQHMMLGRLSHCELMTTMIKNTKHTNEVTKLENTICYIWAVDNY